MHYGATSRRFRPTSEILIDYTRDLIQSDYPKMKNGLPYTTNPTYDALWRFYL